MNTITIKILSANKVPAQTAKGGAYEKLNLAYANLSFGEKVEGKNLTPFGDGKAAYDTLLNAQNGQVYEIAIVKANGYNNWTSATLHTGTSAAAVVMPGEPQGSTYQPKAAATAIRSNTYETPEERAKKQVYIVRQSSISAAVAALSVGSKSSPKASEVIGYAKELEAYVFDNGVLRVDGDSGFEDFVDDLPN